MNGRSPAAWAALGFVALLAAGGGFILSRRGGAPAETEPAPAAQAPASAPALPAPPSAAPAPPAAALDGSDDRVRAEAARLSPSPLWARWLRQEDLIRRFAAALALTADGESPASALEFLAPARGFTAVRRGGAFYADARCFKRYDALAAAVASIDAQRAASVYRDLRPLLQQACAELDSRRCDLDGALPRAFGELLGAPVPDAPPALVEKGIGYRFADPALEGLSPARKQLLRMGPRNEKLIQDKLRELAAALGYPSR